ncbi:MAG: alpha-amylase/4-alpha-glucanotransferase domain-containing protein [Campylobacterota bacterium]|nr:alpha-amylase/4-alpha-glucanotransferase domain-containing protein [Campylobacterota bacterium]
MHTSLLFGIHCHQPIDNFGFVVEDAIEKSYKPFFEILKEFPEFKIAVHFSGWLLEFIRKNDGELFELMQSLSAQIEFFSGGYYEPVLASIPSRDRVAQITKLNKYIKKYFNQTPKGLWLTERVWENSIISDLKKCSIEYVIVDDYHLIASGYDKNDLNGYFLTEDGGEQIALFPINQKLRYAIPFYSTQETNELLNSFATTKGHNASILFDDGEKFGIWPKTYETVYEKEWLRRFLTQTLEDEAIKVETYKEYFNSNNPISLAYLPSVSYQEMGGWALGSANTLALEGLLHQNSHYAEFIKGGIWKNFLTKYQESNWIHKRVLELSKKQLDTVKYKEALFKAECNDVLWHGVFGGIYLPNLRDTSYRYIIECENLLDSKSACEALDIDMDGSLEYKHKTADLITIISASHGGQIFELDLKDRAFNLQNTMRRYEEAYHSKIEVTCSDDVCEEDEVATIHDNKLRIDEGVSIDYDWYFKKSAIDHISDDSFTIQKFKSCSFKEYGDFVNHEFELVKQSKKSLQLKRDGGVFLDEKYATSISKTYKFKDNAIALKTALTSTCNQPLSYINEWNFHFANIEDVTFNELNLEDELVIKSSKLLIKDGYLNKSLEFSFDDEIEILIYLVKSASQSEAGVDLTAQGVAFGFKFEFEQELETLIGFKVDNI